MNEKHLRIILRKKGSVAKAAIEYLGFLESCPEPDSSVTEKHHILPKSLFPKYKKDPANIKNLRMRDHVWAHYHLCSVFPASLKMAYAYNQMIGRDPDAKSIKELSELYEEKKLAVREACRQRSAGRKQSAETIAKRVAKIRGKKRTQAQREAISLRMKGKKFGPMSEARKLQISKAQKGRKDSPETREKKSRAMRGKKKSAEHVEKIRKVSLGKRIYILPDGTKKKMYPEDATGLTMWVRPNRFEENGNAKLDFSKAMEIRKLLACGISKKEIANRFLVSPSAIYAIASGKRWRAVDIETIEGENVL